MSEATLNRSLSLPVIVLYGLGTIVGAGVYALIGEVTGAAGLLAPVSFLLASVLAGFSAFSLAELSSRIPKAAGEAAYVKAGFNSSTLALIVGVLVVTSGMVSAATIVNGFVGYFQDLVAIPREAAIAGFVLLLGAIAAIGVNMSVGAAVVITIIEVAGLIVIIMTGWHQIPTLSFEWQVNGPEWTLATYEGVAFGALLSFYAFIGFEDMVNMAEETKNPSRTLPRAIVFTLLLTGVLYVLLSLVAISTLEPDVLASSGAPLSEVFAFNTAGDGAVISSIGVLAMLNGALIQIVMGTRVLYGLARQGNLPKLFGTINPRTRTPLLSTGVVTAIVFVLAMSGTLRGLAQVTALITLTVFTIINLALMRIKRQDPNPPGAVVYPLWVPQAGFVVSGAFLLWQLIGTFN